jgi:hypothetical protein
VVCEQLVRVVSIINFNANSPPAGQKHFGVDRARVKRIGLQTAATMAA